MDTAELAAWLRLMETPGVGRESARRLLAAMGSPQAVFDAPLVALEHVVGAHLAGALRQAPAQLDGLVSTTRAWLQAATPSCARALLTLGDPHYPQALLDTADPPLMLYMLGNADLLSSASVAMVGSRKPTAQGLEIARELATALAQRGYTIVSGLAMGIDGAAHDAALGAGGRSIAVVGTGLDRVYPARHRALAHRLAHEGLLVSEFSLGTPPLAGNFPQRNRIIAHLCQGTLVVEAALQSGSLITARLASEAGREVFAVPGSIRSSQSRGCHALIRQGAKLVESAEDVVEELQPQQPALPGMTHRSVKRDVSTDDQVLDDDTEAPLSAQDKLLDALGADPVTLDALVARTGRSPQDLGIALLELELEGRVARLPGQLFQCMGRG
jgi:DNA processing protein